MKALFSERDGQERRWSVEDDGRGPITEMDTHEDQHAVSLLSHSALPPRTPLQIGGGGGNATTSGWDR